MQVHLVDGTYELFRAHFGAPPAKAPDGREVGATRGIMRSMLSLLGEDGVTHVAVSFDHVIESFRNDMYAGYKTSAGVDAELLAQFPLAERATEVLGLVTWPLVEFEADDGIATAAARFKDDPEVERIVVCSPDKDLSQLVEGTRVVCFDRMRGKVTDEAGVVEKFGVGPAQIPDYLALVGDSADGYPGVPKWGAKSSAALLSRYGSIEAIPSDAMLWDVAVRGAPALSLSLETHRTEAALYKQLATLCYDVPMPETLDDLRWQGADRQALTALCRDLGDEGFLERVSHWRT
ncbi:MAG TPA: 5'-3' exonuclease H3TH domain-containing protein [Dehalococcoidia bacterium]|nr:5'-3' exonuclease H3TH domain-containing protein [Dehalococcoidia bacterium]